MMEQELRCRWEPGNKLEMTSCVNAVKAIDRTALTLIHGGVRMDTAHTINRQKNVEIRACSGNKSKQVLSYTASNVYSQIIPTSELCHES